MAHTIIHYGVLSLLSVNSPIISLRTSQQYNQNMTHLKSWVVIHDNGNHANVWNKPKSTVQN